MNVGRLLRETDLDTGELRSFLGPIQLEGLSLKPASPVVMRLWGPGIRAMTLGRLIFVDPAVLRGDRLLLARLVVHELVHVSQWNALGIFGFLGSYLGDYLRGRRRGLRHHDAYLEIGLEIEARATQTRLTAV